MENTFGHSGLDIEILFLNLHRSSVQKNNYHFVESTLKHQLKKKKKVKKRESNVRGAFVPFTVWVIKKIILKQNEHLIGFGQYCRITL